MSDIVERLGMPCSSNDALRQRVEAKAEIERLQAAKTAALKIADERSRENVDLRAENERLQAELAKAHNLASEMFSYQRSLEIDKAKRSKENVELRATIRLLEEKIEAQRCEMRGMR